MAISLKLFFKYRGYRKLWIRSVKSTIVRYTRMPFDYAKAFYSIIKTYIDYPNRWERYVKFKEFENEAEHKKALEAKAIAYVNLIGTIFSFDISLLGYCSYINREDVAQESFDDLYEKFAQSKQEFKKFANELEARGVNIPEELKSIIESTNIDSFTDFEEYKKFSENLHAISDTINVTYD